jgi:hypothetical protein
VSVSFGGSVIDPLGRRKPYPNALGFSLSIDAGLISDFDAVSHKTVGNGFVECLMSSNWLAFGNRAGVEELAACFMSVSCGGSVIEPLGRRRP